MLFSMSEPELEHLVVRAKFFAPVGAFARSDELSERALPSIPCCGAGIHGRGEPLLRGDVRAPSRTKNPKEAELQRLGTWS